MNPTDLPYLAQNGIWEKGILVSLSFYAFLFFHTLKNCTFELDYLITRMHRMTSEKRSNLNFFSCIFLSSIHINGEKNWNPKRKNPAPNDYDSNIPKRNPRPGMCTCISAVSFFTSTLNLKFNHSFKSSNDKDMTDIIIHIRAA